MVKVIDDDVRLCTCCALKLANDDTSGCEAPGRGAEHPHGVMGADMAGKSGLVIADGYDDFSDRRCDGCGTRLAGTRVHAVILG